MERYTVLRVIGEGGSGRVLLVEDTLRPGSRLALKELVESTPEQVALLRREFTTLASLRHPSLAEVYAFEVGADGTRPRFTMELVDGEDLVTTLRREGPAALVPLAAEALQALAFLHDFGLVHRDVKPGNLLARHAAVHGRRVVLVDFGLAAERHVEAASAGMAGTLPYLAPELFEGTPPSKKTDLYALGVVLYEAVYGRTPFVLKGNDTGAFIQAVREGRRARPSMPAGYPAGLSRFLEDLIAPDPAARPTSAIDALARLNEACGTNIALESTEDRAARLGSGPPVGRDDELARLRAELEASDRPRVVWLAGDAGSGKSRLLRFLAAEAIGKGWVVHVPPGALPERTDAFVDRVRADAAQAPTLIVLDEVERADAEVASFLDRIAREPRESPVRVLAAIRPGEIEDARIRKLLADTGLVPSLARIDLAPMGDAALRAMIDRATAGKSSPQARAAWLAEASEGNAGAAEALLVEGIWERHAKVPVARALEQSIQRRLATLSPESRSWLEALAVLGDDAAEPLVAELSGLEDAAPAAAAEALAVGLARRTGATLAPDSRRVAETVRGATPPDRLRQLHALAATHYAAQERDVFGATAWRLARLWRGAGETERAVSAALDAASAAEVHKEWPLAAERYAFALRCLPRRDARRGELWWKRANALRLALLHAAAAKAWNYASRSASDPMVGHEAMARRARALYHAGKLDQSRAVARQVADDARKAGAGLAEAVALETLAMEAVNSFRFEESLEAATRAAELASRVGGEDHANALNALATAQYRLNHPEALATNERALEIARASGFAYLELAILAGRTQMLERFGRFAEMSAVGDELYSVGQRHVGGFAQLRSLTESARCDLTMGRYDRAISRARLAKEMATYFANPTALVAASLYVAESLFFTGRAQEASASLDDLPKAILRQCPREWAAYVPVMRLQIRNDAELDMSTLSAADRESVATLRGASAGLRLAALELELTLARRGIDAPRLQASLAEFDQLWDSTAERLGPLNRAGSNVTAARAAMALNDPQRALGYCDDPFGKSLEGPVPLVRARLRFLAADALVALNRAVDAQALRTSGAQLLDVATERIGDLDLRKDFLEQPSVGAMLQLTPRPADEARLETLYEMIRILNSETDPEQLLASILEMAMTAVEAERGMILLAGPSGADFSVRLARNLEPQTEADAEAFSRRIVAEAGQGKAILALDAGHDDRFKDFKSVSLYRIRSLMCAPLRSRGRIVGTVYLDSRRHGHPFTQGDLRFVEAFSDHAALALENARRRAELESENRRLKAIAGERANYGEIVGRSPAMQRVFDLLERVVTSDVTVLIQGESGTGKELVAKAVHFNGPRKDKPFLSENCAALPETLLESELFGHVKGAFTGADRDRTGLFEQAHRGTLFLDEIGDTSPAMQARLLRVLQEGELRPVGGSHSIKVDVRVIAATNKDLPAEIAAGRFREDLYYRLAVVPVVMPPLRERAGDISFLAGRLLERLATSRGRPVPRIDADVLDAFERYAWPGNVRQLENLLRRIMILAGDGPITRAVLEGDSDLSRTFLGSQPSFIPVMSIAKGEEAQIRRALEAAAGHRDRAARLLGISRATIYRKMREYKIP